MLYNNTNVGQIYQTGGNAYWNPTTTTPAANYGLAAAAASSAHHYHSHHSHPNYSNYVAAMAVATNQYDSSHHSHHHFAYSPIPSQSNQYYTHQQQQSFQLPSELIAPNQFNQSGQKQEPRSPSAAHQNDEDDQQSGKPSNDSGFVDSPTNKSSNYSTLGVDLSLPPQHHSSILSSQQHSPSSPPKQDINLNGFKSAVTTVANHWNN